MAGFWGALHLQGRAARVAGLGFFIGLALGLLAKGPVALILTILPIGAWALWTRNIQAAISRLPWLSGGVLLAVLVVPWYWAAERATPGFLDYFLIGEHWKRFTQPGWTGDLYGAAHARPRGVIWAFWLGVALPWSLAAVAWLARAALLRRTELRDVARDPWQNLFRAVGTGADGIFHGIGQRASNLCAARSAGAGAGRRRPLAAARR